MENCFGIEHKIFNKNYNIPTAEQKVLFWAESHHTGKSNCHTDRNICHIFFIPVKNFSFSALSILAWCFLTKGDFGVSKHAGLLEY